MQRLHNALEAAAWLKAHVTGDLRTDSRKVQPGDAFLAWPGAVKDGRHFLVQALTQGASACLMEEAGHEAWLQDLSGPSGLADGSSGIPWAVLPELKAQAGWVADAYYQHPSHPLSVLAVTGTNGKTSVACWLAQALTSPVLNHTCGVVGTLGVGQWPQLESTGMTTPDPVLLQRQFKTMADAGVTHCAIEASSIGLAEHRLAGTNIRVALFTNLTQDHLDYHGNMAAYAQAKKALFAWPGLRAAVINVDDAQGAELAQQLKGQGLEVWTCSRRHLARLQARPLVCSEGLAFEVVEGDQVQTLRTGLMGDFNIDNLLAVLGGLRAVGVDLAQAVQACSLLQAVPGRMQRVSLEASGPAEHMAPMVVVDYAHTPDAVAQALNALRSQALARGGQLWCILGCGGERDATKRPLMAAAAEAAADRVMLTSDNPRSESPQAILAAMVVGLRQPQNVQQQVDRALAIETVLSQVSDRDVVLVAGKGHETAQEIQGVRHHFSDVQQAQRAWAKRHRLHAGASA